MVERLTNPFDLEAKVAIVTGGAGGIGAGIAAVLAEAGAIVVIADRDEAGARRLAATLKERGHRADALHVDLADEILDRASVRSGDIPPRRTLGCWSTMRVYRIASCCWRARAGEWDRTNAINARGPFLMTREIARAMAAGGRGGRIVNIGSAALVGSLVKGLAAYSASKGALLGLSRASAFELVDHAITVNTVLPGGVATPGAIGAKGPAAEGPARRRPPLGTCEPRDIGAAVLFFASPAARYITNQVLTVDGGWSVT